MSTETEQHEQLRAESEANDRHAQASKGVTWITQSKRGLFETLRWTWWQLTSMRAALFLLLILAIAAVPGSVFPQRSIDATRVTTYLAQHAIIGPWLDNIRMFDVFSSPWFAASYILLLISLIGCIVPRIRLHCKALRSPLPRVPKRLERLPASTTRTIDGAPGDVMTAVRELWRRKGYRVRVDEPVDGVQTAVAAGGRMRETGNLLFHTCLVLVVLAVAADHLMGWRGDVIVPVRQSFSSAAGTYTTLDLGPWVSTSDIKPWSVTMKNLDVTFEKNVPKSSSQYGQPRNFVATVTTQEGSDQPMKRTLAVNDALDIAGASVYLLGNGYAPIITVRSPQNKVLYRQATPFLPQDNFYRSVGAIKVPAASPRQLGLFGFFLPTAQFDNKFGPISAFPGPKKPALFLGAYTGKLFPDDLPQSVYTLDTQDMKQVTENGQPWRRVIYAGQVIKLPDGTSVSCDANIPRWAGLSVRYDPGKTTALIAALFGLAGLIMSITLQQRRIFVKISVVNDEGGDGAVKRRTLINAGALAKGEDPRLQVVLDMLLDGVDAKLGNNTTADKTGALR